MSNLLFFLFLLACPVMMIFMMRGMHGGGGTKKMSHDAHEGAQMDQRDAAARDLQPPDERIAQLEHEVAQLRALQSRQADRNRASGS
ncbi:MAG: DUF2933 domain-containing protein [Sporichthyaceae bacterium]